MFYTNGILGYLRNNDPSRHTTSFQRLYDVYTTSATSYRRRINVETTSCVYSDVKFYRRCNRSELNKLGKPLKRKFITSKAGLDIQCKKHCTVYELSHELPNGLRLTILENLELLGKFQKWLEKLLSA